MSVKYFHLTVKEIIEETPDTKTFSFWHPVHNTIPYKAGQFLTLMPVIDGQKVRRSYSMSSSPNKDSSIAVSIKRVANGLVSNYLCDNLKVGDAIEIMEPMGHFVIEPNPNKERTIVLFGGGSGITPLMSILKSVLPVEQKTKVYLVYGSRDEDSIIFKRQLMELEQQYEGRLRVLHVLSKPSYTWTGYKTRINQASAVTFLKQDFAIDIASAEY
jgi:ring-1,2-phenylacetyl-CoA epoxidase subunit PaaE